MDVRRRAGWLPEGQDQLEAWLAGHRERAEGGEPAGLHPVVQELQDLLDSDPTLRMYFERMVAEAPRGKSYSQRHLQSVPQLLRLINEVLRSAPEFSEDSMVMTPLGAVLDWPTGTTAGFAAFRDPRVNAMLQKILRAWCEFLTSRDSLYVLNDSPSGWKSAAAQQAVGMEQYRHDPDDEHWGFASWNDFFTRRFNDGERPVAAPDDDAVIVSACESTPYNISRDVRRTDQFWVKSQSYSLRDMLADDPSVDDFVGGTVYQAFLSATNYHRWHSPVAGTVVRSFVVDGTYYSEADSEGADAVEPQNSQGYMAHVATRAIIVLEADNPAIGQVAFLAVGMFDVSSCMIHAHVTAGYHLSKGEELGYFQFGGSTHCLVLRPGVVADFSLQAIPQPHDPDAPLVQVLSHLATATRP
jgi:phosphatidylserine decarboxylase